MTNGKLKRSCAQACELAKVKVEKLSEIMSPLVETLLLKKTLNIKELVCSINILDLYISSIFCTFCLFFFRQALRLFSFFLPIFPCSTSIPVSRVVNDFYLDNYKLVIIWFLHFFQMQFAFSNLVHTWFWGHGFEAA